jgi:hypothetical protein
MARVGRAIASIEINDLALRNTHEKKERQSGEEGQAMHRCSG